MVDQTKDFSIGLASAGTLPVTIDCPGLIVVSEMNERCHWAKRAKRMAGQKDQVMLAIVLARLKAPLIKDPVRITFTRFGVRKLDSDNCQGAFKAVRDAVCSWIGVDDGNDALLTFEYLQARGEPGVRVEIAEL